MGGAVLMGSIAVQLVGSIYHSLLHHLERAVGHACSLSRRRRVLGTALRAKLAKHICFGLCTALAAGHGRFCDEVGLFLGQRGGGSCALHQAHGPLVRRRRQAHRRRTTLFAMPQSCLGARPAVAAEHRGSSLVRECTLITMLTHVNMPPACLPACLPGPAAEASGCIAAEASGESESDDDTDNL